MPGSSKDSHYSTVTVGACHAQTGADRVRFRDCYLQDVEVLTTQFGPDGARAIKDRERVALGHMPTGIEWPSNWPGSDSDDDDGEAEGFRQRSIYKTVPSMQWYRNNLTALSQRYNLYFAAYRGRIFVYMPRSMPKQTLPQLPDLQLRPKPSAVAIAIGGYIDRASGHCINHVITGLLGQEEILLMCFDDGDVTAYYTKEIAKLVLARSEVTNSVGRAERRRSGGSASYSSCEHPKPFFLENVGISAWGLAIHQKSRLIAVSSNRREVTVFASALPGRKERPCDCKRCCDSVESHVRARARNWRIIVSLGATADNIPNVCFVDDERGHAEKISAIDIKGAVWLADIWKPKQAVVRDAPSSSSLLKSEESWPASSRGWNILTLPSSSFLEVHSEEELLGAQLKNLDMLPRAQADACPLISVARHLRSLPGNPCPEPLFRTEFPRIPVLPPGVGIFNFSDDDDEEEEEEEEDEDEGEEDDDDEEVEEGDEGDDEDGVGDEGFGDTLPAGWALAENVEFTAWPGNIGDGNVGDGDHPMALTVVTPEVDETMVWIPIDDDTSESDQDDGQEGAPIWPAESDSTVHQVITNWPAAAQGVPQAADSYSSSSSAVGDDMPATTAMVPPMNLIMMSLDGSVPAEGAIPAPVPRQEECFRTPARAQLPALLDRVYMPHRGDVCEMPQWPRAPAELAGFLKRRVEHNEHTTVFAMGYGHDAERHLALRMYEKDVEMRPLGRTTQKEPPELGIIVPDVLIMGVMAGRPLRPQFRATSRMSMVAHIPELSLVAIASAIGRVVLVTPTRLSKPQDKTNWTGEAPARLLHGLRVECVLPRAADEEAYRELKRPLHGLAVGPVQQDGVMGVSNRERMAAPRRFRLMLHYRNHDVLTYEISRESETGKVCIF